MYDSLTRSNYCVYEDPEAFRKLCDEAPDFKIIETRDGDVLRLGFITNSEGEVQFADEQGEERDFISEAAALLADGEVLVVTSAGYDKARYAAGWAVAINKKGDERRVNIDEIYTRAAELAPADTRITAAEY